MPDGRKFLLGYGERLTERVVPPPGGGGSEPAYTAEEAVLRLTPMLSATSSILDNLPSTACPRGEAVGVIALHPQWIAKSYHPQQLLKEFDLRQVGSRPVEIQPEKWTKQVEPELAPTTELFVAGPRASFENWSSTLSGGGSRMSQNAREQLRRIELVRAPTASERLRIDAESSSIEGQLLEVVLHASESASSNYILSAFNEYALNLGARPHFERRLHAGGLCFVPVEAGQADINELARFAFLRVARPMPRLREIQPIERAMPSPSSQPCALPTEDSVDPDLHVAIFDGGIPEDFSLERWVNRIEPQETPSTPFESGVEHGQNVTSALLFGSLNPGKPAPRPYAVVDHFRVLDQESSQDPYELYDALRRIQATLKERNYEFFNLSIGPAMSIEDDEVHPWTAILDEYLSDGHALATIAVGNNGTKTNPRESRIQVPSDSVNAMGIGAADSQRAGWKRAEYSAFGPGRSPGLVKPDVLHFGGDQREPFIVYDTNDTPNLATTGGTSFASPAALRMALGVRAHFGDRISPLALKALLIHGADHADMDKSEVGWGRLPQEIDDLVVCADGSVRVVYQGEISPSQYLRALIPLPEQRLAGFVTVDVTFCYATTVDPQDPGSYTRSGLDVVFRPHAEKFKNADSIEPESKPFFQRSEYDNERTLRNDAHKWETTLNRSKRFRGTSLYRPVFDIHHNARVGGGIANTVDRIRYALIVTVHSNKTPDIYDQVVRTYAGRLEALQPRIEIPIRT